VRSFLSETQWLQDRLWTMAVANARTDMNSDVAALYIDSLNEVNAIHASRVAVGIQARVPSEIWVTLYCITILGMMSVGYQTGIAGSQRSMARPILALSFALVFALIASLDRPDSGVIKVNQQPLIDLRASMAAGRRARIARTRQPRGDRVLAPRAPRGFVSSARSPQESNLRGARTKAPVKVPIPIAGRRAAPLPMKCLARSHFSVIDTGVRRRQARELGTDCP
jgi:hypothetical protein